MGRGKKRRREWERGKCVQSHFLLPTRAINMLDIYQSWSRGWAGCVCWVYTLCLAVQIIHPEHLSTWAMTPENSCNWAHPTNWWQPARRPFLPLTLSLLLFFLWHSSFTHIYSLHLIHFPPPLQRPLSLIFPLPSILTTFADEWFNAGYQTPSLWSRL